MRESFQRVEGFLHSQRTPAITVGGLRGVVARRQGWLPKSRPRTYKRSAATQLPITRTVSMTSPLSGAIEEYSRAQPSTSACGLPARADHLRSTTVSAEINTLQFTVLLHEASIGRKLLCCFMGLMPEPWRALGSCSAQGKRSFTRYDHVPLAWMGNDKRQSAKTPTVPRIGLDPQVSLPLDR